MHRFELWAPRVKKLEVCIGGSDEPMVGPDDEGWWTLDVADAGPGTDYGFLVDDDTKPYPDPRSRWQPHGVHGLSRVFDQGLYAWSDARFQARPLASAVIYEMHVGTFTPEGTLDAAIGRLEHVVELGATHVELMPVASFAGDHGWGYDGVTLFAVHEPYGGPEALKRFVDAAHGKGLAVLLDVVYNHFGPVGNYWGKFGPYLVDSHTTPWGDAVNLEDAWAHQVRRYFCDNALMWLRDFHVDGLRLDAVHAFIDRSAIHFLEQLSAEVAVLSATMGRQLVLIAESDANDPRVVTPREAGGQGMDAQWNDDFHHALHALLSPETPQGYFAGFGELPQLAQALEESFVYNGVYSSYRMRIHGRTARNVPQHRFVGYIQNHDQVGNRALGERIHEVAGLDRARIAAAFVLLGPFVPFIFQGEEWAASTPFQFFADHGEEEMARLVAEGRRREFAALGWEPATIPDPAARETFTRSKLNWDEVNEVLHREMLAWYRALIHRRRTTPSLNITEPGFTRVRYDAQARWLVMQRGEVTVACNLGGSSWSFPVPEGSEVTMGSRGAVAIEDEAALLPPDTVVIFSKREDGSGQADARESGKR